MAKCAGKRGLAARGGGGMDGDWEEAKRRARATTKEETHTPRRELSLPVWVRLVRIAVSLAAMYAAWRYMDGGLLYGGVIGGGCALLTSDIPALVSRRAASVTSAEVAAQTGSSKKDS